MTKHTILSVLFGSALFAAGCAAAPPVVVEPGTAAAAAPAPPAASVSRLTFLVAPDPFAPPLARGATYALRATLEDCGLHVVTDPKAKFDIELLASAHVWGSEPRDGVVTEHVRYTLVAVASGGRRISEQKAYFDASDGAVGVSQVRPAVDELLDSTRMREFGVSAERERTPRVFTADL